jgi:hypothetical protein
MVTDIVRENKATSSRMQFVKSKLEEEEISQEKLRQWKEKHRQVTEDYAKHRKSTGALHMPKRLTRQDLEALKKTIHQVQKPTNKVPLKMSILSLDDAFFIPRLNGNINN